jgi:hypothetical protein
MKNDTAWEPYTGQPTTGKEIWFQAMDDDSLFRRTVLSEAGTYIITEKKDVNKAIASPVGGSLVGSMLQGTILNPPPIQFYVPKERILLVAKTKNAKK